MFEGDPIRMTLGESPDHADVFRSSSALCDHVVGEASIDRLLHDHGHRLFPDDSFADLFTARAGARSRRASPPSW